MKPSNLWLLSGAVVVLVFIAVLVVTFRMEIRERQLQFNKPPTILPQKAEPVPSALSSQKIRNFEMNAGHKKSSSAS